MNDLNELEIDRETDASEIFIDHARFRNFFDKKYVKKVSTWLVIAWIVAIIGGVLAYLVTVNRWSMGWLAVPGWLVFGAGVLLLIIFLPKVIKESELTDVFKGKSRLFKDIISDKLEYPEDMGTMSISFMGAIVDDSTRDVIRKLKSGNYVSPEMRETVIYCDTKKKGLFIAIDNYSMVEDKEKFYFKEIPFSDFDSAGIVKEEIAVGAVSDRFVVKKGEIEIFSSPMANNDYYKEEFMNTIEHFRSTLG